MPDDEAHVAFASLYSRTSRGEDVAWATPGPHLDVWADLYNPHMEHAGKQKQHQRKLYGAPKCGQAEAAGREIGPSIGGAPAEFAEIDPPELEQSHVSALYAIDAWFYAQPSDGGGYAISGCPTPERDEAHRWRGAAPLPVRDALRAHAMDGLSAAGIYSK